LSEIIFDFETRLVTAVSRHFVGKGRSENVNRVCTKRGLLWNYLRTDELRIKGYNVAQCGTIDPHAISRSTRVYWEAKACSSYRYLRNTARAFGENKCCHEGIRSHVEKNVISMSLTRLAKNKGASLVIAVMLNKIFNKIFCERRKILF